VQEINRKTEQTGTEGEQDFETKQQQQKSPIYVSPPLKSVEFPIHVIDRQDGFPEPITEKISWLVRN